MVSWLGIISGMECSCSAIEPIIFLGIGFFVASLLGLNTHSSCSQPGGPTDHEAPRSGNVAAVDGGDSGRHGPALAPSSRCRRGGWSYRSKQMKAKPTSQLAELGKKTDAINRLEGRARREDRRDLSPKRDETRRRISFRHRIRTLGQDRRCAKPSACCRKSRASCHGLPPTSASAPRPPTARASKRPRPDPGRGAEGPRLRSRARSTGDQRPAHSQAQGGRARPRPSSRTSAAGSRSSATASLISSARWWRRPPRPRCSGAASRRSKAGMAEQVKVLSEREIEILAAQGDDRPEPEDRERSAPGIVGSRGHEPRRDREPGQGKGADGGSAQSGQGRARQAAAGNPAA